MTTSNDEKHAKKWLIWMGIIGVVRYAGYHWYWWYGPHYDSQIEAARGLDPTVVMQRCVDEWMRMQKADVGFTLLGTFGAETDCAEMHGLYRQDGKWQRKQEPQLIVNSAPDGYRARLRCSKCGGREIPGRACNVCFWPIRPVKMTHRFGSDATVASGHLQLAAPSVTLRRNVDFLQHGPTILPTRHSGASWKIAMAVVGVVWLGSVALWMLKEFDNVD